MHYLLDGYNLIFSFTHSRKNLELLRRELIDFLENAFSEKNLKGTLVFDGAHLKDEESGFSYRPNLLIAYAPKGQTADEYILERLALCKNPKLFTVVSNDRGLKRRASALGAKSLENSPFFSWLKKKRGEKEKKEFKDSPKNIARLLKIFEEELKKNL